MVNNVPHQKIVMEVVIIVQGILVLVLVVSQSTSVVHSMLIFALIMFLVSFDDKGTNKTIN